MGEPPNGAFAAIVFGFLTLVVVVVTGLILFGCQRAQPPGAGVYQGLEHQEQAR